MMMSLRLTTTTTVLLSCFFLLLLNGSSASQISKSSASVDPTPVRNSLISSNGDNKNVNDDTWFPHPTDSNRRRRRLRPIVLAAEKEKDGGGGEHDCLLLLKVMEYENHHENDEYVWTCEFSHEVATKALNRKTRIAIDASMKNIIDAFHPISGTSLLKSPDMFIEEKLDTNAMTISIPQNARTSIQVTMLDDTHPRHYKRRRKRRSTGNFSVLVVNVIDSDNQQNSLSSSLYEDWFTDEFSLKTAYQQCSKNQMMMNPATNVANNGILTVSIDIPAATSDLDTLEFKAYDALNDVLGENEMTDSFDFAAFCLPQNDGSIAYAYINSWDSYFNAEWCNMVSVQMHELGHNLGLGHSNTPDCEYGDMSGVMGTSYFDDDGPKMCFNAAKNYQLGWYERQQFSFDPLANINKAVNFIMNGVSEYKTSGNTDGKLITLRIVMYGDDYGTDYYVGFNDAYGVNEGTLEGRNEVLLFEKLGGGPDDYGESNRLKTLGVGQAVTIKNFKDTANDVTITFKSLTNGGRDANIVITTTQDDSGDDDDDDNDPPIQEPTPAPVDVSYDFPSVNPADNDYSVDFPSYNPADINYPTDDAIPQTFEPISPSVPISMKGNCADGRSKFQVNIQTDDYPGEMYWQLVSSDGAILAGSERAYLDAQTQFYDPSEQQFYCLESGSYTFKMVDAGGDGFCCAYGFGHMIGVLEGEEIFSGNEFEAEESHAFIVEELPTDGPPESCQDEPGKHWIHLKSDGSKLKYKNTCMWAGKAPKNRCKKMHEDWTRSVADSCPVTCDKCTTDGPPESCQDEPGKHWIHLKSNGTKLRKRTCAQAAKKPNTWCKRKLKDMIRKVADICPETCDKCNN